MPKTNSKTNSESYSGSNSNLDIPFFIWGIRIALLSFVFIWCLLAIPGRPFVTGATGSIKCFRHGWPWVHMDRAAFVAVSTPTNIQYPSELRIIVDSRLDENREGLGRIFLDCRDTGEAFWHDDELDYPPYWTSFENLSHAGERKIHWGPLAINLSLFLVLLFVLRWLLRFRVHRKGFKASFLEIGIATSIIALACLYLSSRATYEKNRTSLEKLEAVNLYYREARHDTYPDFLVRLVGRCSLPKGDHFQNVVIDFEEVAKEDQLLIANSSRALRYVQIAKLRSVRDDTVDTFQNLFNSYQLTLSDPEFRDSNWRCLSNFSELFFLRVHGDRQPEPTKIANTFFHSIKSLPLLYELELAHYEFTDDGFGHLSETPAITRLTLDECPISESMLQTIISMPVLKRLSVRGGLLTNDQANTLKDSCPNLLIVR